MRKDNYCTNYKILSPQLDQSQSIVGFLSSQRPDGVSCLYDDEGSLLFRGSETSHSNLVKASGIDGNRFIEVPTGAISTRELLQVQDVRLGNIVLTRDALKVFDKPWVLRKAYDAGVPVPSTWLTVDEIAAYPVFYKQNQERGGGIRGIAYTADQVPVDGREHLLYQEYIDTAGTYGVGFLARNGVILTSHVHYERSSIPKAGGSAVVVERFFDQRLYDYATIMIGALDYSGWGLVEFKYCKKRDNYVLMEVNPKFWASIEMAFRNEPAFLKELFHIESKEVPVDRIIFLERALARGLSYCLFELPRYVKGSEFKTYHGWVIRTIARAIPRPVRRVLKAAFFSLRGESKKLYDSRRQA